MNISARALDALSLSQAVERKHFLWCIAKTDGKTHQAWIIL